MSYKSSLYTPDISSLSDIRFTNIFSYPTTDFNASNSASVACVLGMILHSYKPHSYLFKKFCLALIKTYQTQGHTSLWQCISQSPNATPPCGTLVPSYDFCPQVTDLRKAREVSARRLSGGQSVPWPRRQLWPRKQGPGTQKTWGCTHCHQPSHATCTSTCDLTADLSSVHVVNDKMKAPSRCVARASIADACHAQMPPSAGVTDPDGRGIPQHRHPSQTGGVLQKGWFKFDRHLKIH